MKLDSDPDKYFPSRHKLASSVTSYSSWYFSKSFYEEETSKFIVLVADSSISAEMTFSLLAHEDKRLPI